MHTNHKSEYTNLPGYELIELQIVPFTNIWAISSSGDYCDHPLSSYITFLLADCTIHTPIQVSLCSYGTRVPRQTSRRVAFSAKKKYTHTMSNSWIFSKQIMLGLRTKMSAVYSGSGACCRRQGVSKSCRHVGKTNRGKFHKVF